MPRKLNAFDSHDFYCINCGKKGIPLTRQQSRPREPFHRKVMYCWHCKHIVNHIECKNQMEKEQFLLDFLEGKFKEEALASLEWEANHPKFQNYLREMK